MTGDYLTETQQLEQRITKALATIRTHWGDMLPTGPAPIRYGVGQAAGIVGDSTPPDYTPDGRPYWKADHTPGGHDVDGTTRLVSLRRATLDALNGWARNVVDDRLMPTLADKSPREIRDHLTEVLPHGQDVHGLCWFLDRHAQWMSGHEAAEVMADELDQTARRIERHVAPTPREWMSLGTCPLEIEQPNEDGQLHITTCGGQVRAWPSGITDPTIAEQRTERQPTCQRCGTEADTRWWYAHMFNGVGMSTLVTCDELIGIIAVQLDWTITHDQVRQWLRRGKIHKHGKDHKGRTLYDHAAVIASIEDDIARKRIKASGAAVS